MYWLLLLLAAADPTPAEVRNAAVIADARSLKGIEYRWEGRNIERLPGLDCLGLMFRPYGRATGRSWKSYEVNPSELVAGGKLGKPVPGVAGVTRKDFDLALLKTGDVLYFLLEGYVIEDKPLMTRNGRKFWPWHTGLYVGDGVVIHAEPGGVVREQPLREVNFDALFATRLP